MRVAPGAVPVKLLARHQGRGKGNGRVEAKKSRTPPELRGNGRPWMSWQKEGETNVPVNEIRQEIRKGRAVFKDTDTYAPTHTHTSTTQETLKIEVCLYTWLHTYVCMWEESREQSQITWRVPSIWNPAIFSLEREPVSKERR